MFNELRWLIPQIPDDPEVLEVHQLSYEFRAELQYRQEFEQYCQWYEAIAAQNRRELQTMQSDINVLGFFTRGWRSRA